MSIRKPLFSLGITPDGKQVIGGAFQMADSLGFPLTDSMDQAKKHNLVISLPHYFASAMEHGWDDIQTFSKIQEALIDQGNGEQVERVKEGCIFLFMSVAKTMEGRNASEIGKAMRLMLEKGTP